LHDNTHTFTAFATLIIAIKMIRLYLYKFCFTDSSLATNSNVTLNIDTANVNYDIENVSTILNKVSDVKQSLQCCDEFDSTSKIYENANVIEKSRNSKKTPKILKIENVNILVKKTTLPMHTEKINNITYNNAQLNNTYSFTNNNNVFSNANKTFIIDKSDDTFAPDAESTPTEKQLEHENNDNSESDTSITFKNNFDDSFHLSDCSTPESTDEDEAESTHEYTINTSKNKSVNSTLNLTSSLSKICDDRNMYVETSDNLKSKLSMCLYCKNLQTQIARHLESVHKEEEDVKKFCFLPKSKLYVIYKVNNI